MASLLLGQCVNVAVKAKHVDFAFAVLGEARRISRWITADERAMGCDFAVLMAEAPNSARGIIAVDINAAQRRNVFAAIDIPTGDAHADAVIGEFAFSGKVRIMRIFDDGVERFALHFGLLEFVKAFANTPAVIAAFCDKVHLLPLILADIGGPELARLAIKTHPPNIP